MEWPLLFGKMFWGCQRKHMWDLNKKYINKWINININIWVNYNISLTRIKAMWGWFPLLTMIPVRSQWGRYNLPRNIYIHTRQKYIYIYTHVHICIKVLFKKNTFPPLYRALNSDINIDRLQYTWQIFCAKSKRTSQYLRESCLRPCCQQGRQQLCSRFEQFRLLR